MHYTAKAMSPHRKPLPHANQTDLTIAKTDEERPFGAIYRVHSLRRDEQPSPGLWLFAQTRNVTVS